MANPLVALQTLGIQTIQELTALSTLFGHKQRDVTSKSLDDSEYQTRITPEEEKEFRSWVIHNNVPFNPTERFADYDMRGFWKAQRSGDERAQQDSNTLHFPDTWKTPYHRTFSRESIYAPPDAPEWFGSKLVNKYGDVIYDENDPEYTGYPLEKDSATGLATGKRNARSNTKRSF